jgi:hypothetical protein
MGFSHGSVIEKWKSIAGEFKLIMAVREIFIEDRESIFEEWESIAQIMGVRHGSV